MATIVVAFDESRIIGDGPSIPWRLPEDQKLFKARTSGHTVIMGRKTYDSIPARFRPLPDRKNIVITRSEPKTDANGTVYVNSLEDAIKLASGEAFIIGGGQIYKEALDKNLVTGIVASIVDGTHKGDIFFPEITEDWKVASLTKYCGFTLCEFKKA